MTDHQDWKQVVFKKTQLQEDSTSRRLKKTLQSHAATASTTSSKPAWKIEQEIDSDLTKKPLERVSKTDAQRIILGRCAMKLKQQDLATKLNMKVQELREIENCTAVENKTVLSRIKRFLNVM